MKENKTRPGKKAFFLQGFVLCILAVIFQFCSASGDEAANLSFRYVGHAKSLDKKVAVYEKAILSSDKITFLEPEEECLILGKEKDFWRIFCHDRMGYVPVRAVRDYAEQQPQGAIPEKLCDTVSVVKPATSREDTHLKLQGNLTSDQPMDVIQFFLWDERQFNVEKVYTLVLDEPSLGVDMENYPRLLALKDIKGGRKTLVAEGISGTDHTVLFRCPVYARGRSKPLPNVNWQCKGLPWSVNDDEVTTAWTPLEWRKTLTFTVAPEAKATLMTLEWRDIPDQCIVETLDENENLLSRQTLHNGFYEDSVELKPGVRTISITPTGAKPDLATVRLYAEPYSRHDVHQWEPTPKKLDLLVISAHQDDEFLFLGGTIPAYAAREDVSMGVLYMVNCGRARMREALDGLWAAGLRKYPLCLNLPDSNSMLLRAARLYWEPHKAVERFISLIRQYKPEVIVVQDFRGEYGNGEHRATAAMAAEAVEIAADPEQYPESARMYGTWQIKKLYVHLWAENQIRMDWDQPALDESGIVTPMFLATEAFDRHWSQAASFSLEQEGREFDNTLFGLYYSAAGPDILKNDFLENIK